MVMMKHQWMITSGWREQVYRQLTMPAVEEQEKGSMTPGRKALEREERHAAQHRHYPESAFTEKCPISAPSSDMFVVAYTCGGVRKPKEKEAGRHAAQRQHYADMDFAEDHTIRTRDIYAMPCKEAGQQSSSTSNSCTSK